MNLPVLGQLPLSGFAHPWFFLFLLVIAGLVVLYFSIQRSSAAASRPVREQRT